MLDHKTPTKVCRSCHEEKTLDRFYADPRGTHGKYSYCMPCHNNRVRLRKTGWSPQAYEQAWCKQNGTCAICDVALNTARYAKACADHDHKTGKIRGILCWNCNVGLGNMKDSPKRLRSAIEYLERHARDEEIVCSTEQSVAPE